MAAAAPLTITNALLPTGIVTSLRLVDGVVAATGVEPGVGDSVLDAAGSLVLPAMVEPHAHLDKAFLSESVPNATGDLMGAILGMAAHADSMTRADTERRAERAARVFASNGATAIRTHVDLTEEVGLESLLAVLAARDRVRDVVDVEIVALSGWPICGVAGDAQRGLLRDAIAAGADVIGGCPHLDPDTMESLEYFLEVAAAAGLPVDLHTDEHLDPARSTLAHLADVVASTGFAHTVTASHCVSLCLRPVDEQRRVADALAASGVHVVALPSTNLFLQGRELQQAMPRALAPVAALRAAGVNVAAGWDNLQDPFNPMGRGDCLETAALMSMVGHLLPDEAYHSVSNAGRAIIGLPVAGTEVGMAADLVLIPERTTRAAIAGAPSGRTVIRRGLVVTSPA